MIRRGRSDTHWWDHWPRHHAVGVTRVGGWTHVPPSHDLEPVQVPATVVSGSLTTVDPTAAEPDPARLARGAAVLDRGTAVLEQGVGTRLVPEVLVTDDAQTPRLSVARSGVGTDVADRELVGRSDSFAVSTRATFWTHVTGGRPGDMVRHVWFHENRTVGAVDSRSGVPAGGRTVAGLSLKVTGSSRCGTWQGACSRATSSAARGRASMLGSATPPAAVRSRQGTRSCCPVPTCCHLRRLILAL